jgi:GT2 family glycosyltransferase
MSNSKTPLVSIIIVSFNTRKYTENTINSVIKHTKIPYELIVVDNNSSDDSVKFLQKNKNIKLVALKENLGFGGANNLAASMAKGKYLVFLNSDTLLEEDVISSSVNYLRKHSQVGVYSIKLINPDGSTQASGGFAPTLGRVFTWQAGIDDLPIIGDYFNSIHPHLKFYNQKRNMDWITGAFMVIPKNVFDKTCGFDEKIFMYAEELELCYRIRKLNKKIVYDPTQSLIHFGGASSGSINALVWEVKGILYFFKKHKPIWQLPLAKLAFFKGSILRLIMFTLIKPNKTKQQAYLQILKSLF